MSGSIRVRPARATDASQVEEFTAGTFAWGDYVSYVFEAWLAEPGAVLLVAEQEISGRVVGIVHACCPADGEGWLEGLRVHPAFRRQGIADTLNRAGQDWIAAHGALVVRLVVDEANAPARSQVANLGFQPLAVFVHGEVSGSGALPGAAFPAGEVRLGLPADAALVLGLWTRSPLREAVAGLMSRGWRWWTAGQADVAIALRAFHVLVHPQGFAVVNQGSEPAELRWLEPSGPGVLPALEVARLLALGARQTTAAVGRKQIQALLPASGDLQGGLVAAGFEVNTRLVVYAASLSKGGGPAAQASSDTTW